MEQSISTAKAVYQFFSRLPKPQDNNTPVLSVISAKFKVAINGVELFELLHIQRGNLLTLIQEVEAADWPQETKEAAKRQLAGLLHAIDHHGVLRDWKETKAKFVDPNLTALLFIEQSLGMRVHFDEDQVDQISRLAAQLEEVLEDVRESSLPTNLRRKLISNLSVLLMLLRNFEIVGVDRAWEVASSALLALTSDAAVPAKEKGTLQKVRRVLVASVGLLGVGAGVLHGATDLIAGIGSTVRALEALVGSEQKMIEHKPGGSSLNDSDEPSSNADE